MEDNYLNELQKHSDGRLENAKIEPRIYSEKINHRMTWDSIYPKLCELYDKYYAIRGKKPEYIVINKYTEALIQNCYKRGMPMKFHERLVKLFGVKVAICEIIEDGVLDFIYK